MRKHKVRPPPSGEVTICTAEENYPGFKKAVPELKLTKIVLMGHARIQIFSAVKAGSTSLPPPPHNNEIVPYDKGFD